MWLMRAPCGPARMTTLPLHIPALTQKLVTIENIHVFLIPCANKLTSAFKRFQHCILVAYLQASLKFRSEEQAASNEEINMFIPTPLFLFLLVSSTTGLSEKGPEQQRVK